MDAGALVDSLARDFPQSVEALFVQGQILELFEQSTEAVWCWNECLALDPSYAYAYEQLGLLATKRGEFEQAVEQLGQACDLSSDLPHANLHLGRALANLGRYEEAVVALERQVINQPGVADGWFQLGQSHFQLEDYHRATKCFESALKLHADFPRAWYGLAQASERLGEVERARECRERFVHLEQLSEASERIRRRATRGPLDAQILAQACSSAADIYAAYGSSADAERLWRRAAELDSANSQCRQALSRSLARENRIAEAIVVMQELQTLQPQSVEHLLTLAMLHQQLQEFDAAEGSLKRAIVIAPDRPEALSALAEMFLATGQQLPEALRLARRAVQLQPTAERYFVLSTACMANNDRGGGKAALQEAIRLDPHNPNFARAAGLLEREP